MPNDNGIPKGIMLNNPGNIRAYVNMDYNDGYDRGFAKFRTMQDGCCSLFSQIWINYVHHHLQTLDMFVQRYAPASENDVLAYQIAMSQFLGQSPLARKTKDLDLVRPWNALLFARAIIRVENGGAPRAWPSAPEWVQATTLLAGMKQSGHWGDA